MEIREIKECEMNEALALVWRTFLVFEAPYYSEEGILAFKKSINDENWVKDKKFFGAFENNKILGVIATKNITHIALFFVDCKYHNQGIGRKLYEQMLKINQEGFFTVNSSVYAKYIYIHLGFELIDGMKDINGFKFYPMKCILNSKGKDFYVKND